jgi:hypothetical protein
VRAIAFGGAGHGNAPVFGTGRVVVVGASADFDDDEHAAAHSKTTAISDTRRPISPTIRESRTPGDHPLYGA